MIRKLGYSKNCRSIRALCFWFILFNISGSGKEMRNRFNGSHGLYQSHIQTETEPPRSRHKADRI